MPSLTLAQAGQISEPQECGPGTRVTTAGSGYVEWTSGTLADVRNGVATWQRWPGGSAGDYCDTLRRLVFRGVASGSGFVVTWDEGKADPGPEGVYWQEQASSGSPIDAREFGVKADGVTDDTAALQAAVTAATTGGGMLMLPAGTIRISAAITIGFSQGWHIVGQGRMRTIIQQATTNTPTFRMTSDLTHSWRMRGMRFTWATQQTSSNTSAVAVLFDSGNSTTIFNFVVEDLWFEKGFRGLAINPTASSLAVWGVTMRDVSVAHDFVGSLLRLKCAVSVGQPNIMLDNIYVNATSMVEPGIEMVAANTVNLRGVEFNNGNVDANALISLTTCTAVSLVGCRSEVPVVTVAGTKRIWEFPQTDVQIVGCEIAGVTASGGGTLIAIDAGTGGKLNVMGLQCSGTRADGGYLLPYTGSNLEVIAGLTMSGNFRNDLRTVLGNVEMPSFDSGMQTANAAVFRGDADATLTVGDMRYQCWHTTLTANRTCNLPTSGLVDGMEFVIQRIAGGAFNLVVNDGSGTNADYTIASGTKGFVHYRCIGAGGWIITAAGTFP